MIFLYSQLVGDVMWLGPLRRVYYKRSTRVWSAVPHGVVTPWFGYSRPTSGEILVQDAHVPYNTLRCSAVDGISRF